MYNYRANKQAFGFKRTSIPTLKNNYVPRRKPLPKQITVKEAHMEKLDLEMIHEIISSDWKCPHSHNGTEFYSFAYCKEGIMIEFAKEECKGQGIVYINMEDYSVNDIDVIIECNDNDDIVETIEVDGQVPLLD